MVCPTLSDHYPHTTDFQNIAEGKEHDEQSHYDYHSQAYTEK